MDKKKIAGLLIFIIALGIFIGYPNIQDFQLKREVEALMADGEYFEIIAMFEKEEISEDSWKNFALLKSYFYLNDDTFQTKLDNLIKNDNKKIVQMVVNDMGKELIWLLRDFDKMGGIVFKGEELRNALALSYILGWGRGSDEWDLERAMEIRGDKKEIDMVFLYYHAIKGNIQELIDVHNEVSNMFKEQYYAIISAYVLHGQTINYSSYPEEKIDELLDDHLRKLENLDIPKEIMRQIGLFANRDHYNEPFTIRMLNSPFMTENTYYQYYKLLSQLENSEQREKIIAQLNDGEGFSEVEGLEKTLEIINNGFYIQNSLNINDNGILLFIGDNKRLYKYDLFNQTDLGELGHGFKNDYSYPISSVSTNRSYLFLTGWTDNGARAFFLDDDYGLVKTLDEYSIIVEWVDDHRFYQSFPGGKIYDLASGTETTIDQRDVLFPTIDTTEEYPQIYRITKDSYTQVVQNYIFDYLKGVEINTIYMIKDLESNNIIYQKELDRDTFFLGSNKDYIFAAKNFDSIFVLVTISKSTDQITYLPIYTTNMPRNPTFVRVHKK